MDSRGCVLVCAVARELGWPIVRGEEWRVASRDPGLASL
jgi:adenine/guanine phosphoribosyltransferase-like PRPP-binding protein